MIHSLAGGDLKRNSIVDIAKVEILEGICQGDKYWYMITIPNLQENDIVLVPVGKNEISTKAKIIRIDKNVNEQVCPIPYKRMKEIISKIDEN